MATFKEKIQKSIELEEQRLDSIYEAWKKSSDQHEVLASSDNIETVIQNLLNKQYTITGDVASTLEKIREDRENTLSDVYTKRLHIHGRLNAYLEDKIELNDKDLELIEKYVPEVSTKGTVELKDLEEIKRNNLNISISGNRNDTKKRLKEGIGQSLLSFVGAAVATPVVGAYGVIAAVGYTMYKITSSIVKLKLENNYLKNDIGKYLKLASKSKTAKDINERYGIINNFKGAINILTQSESKNNGTKPIKRSKNI